MEPVSDEFLRDACLHAGVAMIAADANLNVRFWNRAATRIFGGSAESMYGQPIASIVPHERRELAERLIGRTLQSGEVTEFEFPLRDAAGHAVYLAITVSPIINTKGSHAGVTIHIRDVTRRIEAERSMAQSRKMAALGTMAGAISHHFNNLLCGLITSADFARDSTDPQVLQRTLRAVVPILNRASVLTRNLLAFAEGDHSHSPPENVTTIVTRFMESVKAVAVVRKVEIRSNLQPVNAELPAKQLTTILDCLAANASEAMPNGGVLTLELEPAANGREFVLRVSDTGPGIPEDQLTRVFEPFFTTKGLDATGSADHPGLGLAVVHGIVRDLGGSVTFCSSPESGTTFSVRLPCQSKTPAT
ncbi:MAG TPA: PAS domain S-box protein [Phycisphaerae bacterium]|nr:PAS domain S-box protein [Phycisphaerae bacterium]HRY67453.1 PAS domain S-box protein [Phycisphaerae bacterium]HSA27954.1 PAS domain S-box protein [Phycisphaerae bacterium]